MAIVADDIKSILILHFGQLGDVILALPAMGEARRLFPDARITTVTGLAPAEIVRLSGAADEVIAVDRVALRDGPKLGSLSEIFRFVLDIRRRDTDMVIDLHSLKETNILAWLTGARYRLLSNRGNRSFHCLGNFQPAPPPEDRSLHLSRTYMRALSPLGATGEPMPYRLEISAAVKARVGELLPPSEKPLAGLFPGAGNPSRCWPLLSFSALATRLESDGIRPVVFLGPEESEMREAVQNTFASETLILEGLSIAEFIAAARRTRVFISNDTGAAHMAALAGVPLLLVMDVNAPKTYLPLAAEMKVVNSSAIDQISVDEVHSMAVQILGQDRK